MGAAWLQADASIVVPEAGPATTRAALTAFKEQLDTYVAHGRALVADGVDEQHLLRSLVLAEPRWQLHLGTPDLHRFYEEPRSPPVQVH